MKRFLLCTLLAALVMISLAVSASALGEEMTIATGTPKIDGAIDDVWATADRQQLGYCKAGDLKVDAYTLPDTCSVYASALYDNTALYFLFEITDDEFAFESSVGDWKNDSIYLYIDEIGDGDPTWTDQQAQIALIPEDGWEMIPRKGVAPADYELAYTFPTATTCVIEFKYVPRILELKEGVEFTLDFQYNDSIPGGTRDYCLGWSDETDDAANNSGIWGFATLGGAGTAAAPAASEEVTVEADAYAAYASKIPVIDGSIDDVWDTTEAMYALIYENTEWELADLIDIDVASGYTKVLWTEDTLYLLSVITDKTMDSDAKSTTNGINFWVSETNSGKESFNEADGDWHIFCNADGGTNYYTGNKNVYGQAEMAAERTADGYIVEVAVPVMTSGFEYAAGMKIGYNISVDDDHDADNNRDTFTSWQTYDGRPYWEKTVALNEVGLVKVWTGESASEAPAAETPAAETSSAYPSSGESGNFMMGKVIGNETGWDGTEASGAASAFDGKAATFFDPLGVGDGFCGMEFDEPYILEKVAILSRSGWLDRFAGASIEGSNDGEEWETLWESDDVAPSETEYNIATDFENNYGYKMFRYINYVNHGDVAEVEFYGKPGTAERPAKEEEPAPAA
ncbi:MAG: hypothetical protein K6G29_11375, partial [Clostridiales bacterium]|nr:hypothetical protein [Clostridiales bacterium]